MISRERQIDLIYLTRNQIIGYIQDDITGGELLMKEVWEQLDSDEEISFVKQEMKQLILKIKGS